MKRIAELDGLRAIAIVLVLGCHYEGFARLAHRLPEFGWIGVDIFFVLSGYLITTILLGLRHKRAPYKTFYSRRIIRIVPPYIGASLLILALGLVGHHPFFLDPRYIARQLLFLQAYLPGTTPFLRGLLLHPLSKLTHLPALLTHAHHLPLGAEGLYPYVAAAPGTYWSLSIEEYFYLLWAPVVLRGSRRVILSLGIVICALEILLRWIAATDRAYFDLFFRFDALLYGAFLALLLEHWRRTSVPRWATTFFSVLLGLCAAVVAACLLAIRPILGLEIRSSPLVLVVALPAFCLGAACVIALLVLRANGPWWLARLLRTRPFQYIGTISYTMYLVHVLMAVIVLQALRVVHHPNASPFLQAIVATVLTILLARLSWHFLEKPLLRWKDRRFPSAPHPPEPKLN